MNQPVAIPRPPRREEYIPIIKALRPHIGEEELALRASLMLLRDRAIATKPAACEPAFILLNVIQEQASEAALNWRMPIDVLREIRRLCIMCAANASSFNTLWNSVPDEPEAA